ncbi:hypothetical protein Hore_00230 [Halothermothrix orenii H 168]|uniref:Uncharacterized protein n=1 Tax=Halothermothrix orenii (strain H 168 / OCM 544 / DSM 9562) TaxID=373903 RepID=B8D032_HALOH|nr:hypothetical protein Hore_00230 [Halothermothrix orenii H 168]
MELIFITAPTSIIIIFIIFRYEKLRKIKKYFFDLFYVEDNKWFGRFAMYFYLLYIFNYLIHSILIKNILGFFVIISVIIGFPLLYRIVIKINP